VIGGKIIGAVRRSAAPGEFRSNVHRGGTPGIIDLSKREQNLALKAVSAVGLDIAGVDWLETSKGPVILEINATPGFQGFESATGIDVAKAIISFAQDMM
jgi:ribosomal protein S6--L-glutamate ligase